MRGHGEVGIERGTKDLDFIWQRNDCTRYIDRFEPGQRFEPLWCAKQNRTDLFGLRAAMPFSQNHIWTWREFRQNWSALILWVWLAGDMARKSCVSSAYCCWQTWRDWAIVEIGQV